MSHRHHRLHDRVIDAVIAQFCTDFDCVRDSTLQGLREMIVRYMSELSIIAHDEANSAGRTQVNVLDVFTALGRDATTFEHLLYQKTSRQDGGLVRLPGKLLTTRKPKVLPSTDARFLDTDVLLASSNENTSSHAYSLTNKEWETNTSHNDGSKPDWNLQMSHCIRDSSSLAHYESLKRLPYQSLLASDDSKLRPRAHISSFRQHSHSTSKEALLAQNTISGTTSVYETGHLEH